MPGGAIMTQGPLTGIRVLDLTNVLAGPFCCHQLGHLGAEIIKIEVPGRGDLARQLGADAKLNAANMGVSFLAQNAGKRSMTLNLKSPSGVALLMRLVKSADVLVENFRPGVMARLGVGPEVLRAENPALIYAAISGFGQDGPWKNRPAYDQIVQGVAGVMSVTGTDASGPLRVGYPVSDTVGGLTAAFAIAAALNAPERGCVIDVSMLESTLTTMAWTISNFLIAGVTPQRHGNENPTSAPSGAFRVADGYINIAANKDEQWEMLARHLGREHLLRDPDFATREERKRNRLRLRAELECVLVTRPGAEWVAELSRLGIPAGEVLSVPQALTHPQVAARGFLADFADVPGVGRDIQVVRTGLKLNGAPPAVDTPPPELGADTDAILQELGLGTDAIATLRKEGAI